MAVGSVAGTTSAAEELAVGIMAVGVVVCVTVAWMRFHSGDGGWAVVGIVCMFVAIPSLLRHLDGREDNGGDRTGNYFAGFGKLLAGYGAFIAALGFMQA